jgi:hypothetical protein
MLSRSHRLFVWFARIAGLAIVLFASLFALDAFDGRPLLQAIPAFIIHLLPAALVAGSVLLGWRWPWLGAAGFGALAITYVAMVPQRLDWIALIAGPLALVAILFVLSAVSTPRLTAAHLGSDARSR